MRPITPIAYYDRISSQWYRITGHHGGPFKRYVLNDRILARIEGVVETEDIFPDEKTFHARPGLKLPRGAPLALLLDCRVR